MLKNKINIKEIIYLANNLITLDNLIISHVEAGTSKAYTEESVNLNSNSSKINNKCDYCLNPKLKGLKHTHFVRSHIINDNLSKQPQATIEQVFDQIDEKANKNAEKIIIQGCPNPPGNKILHNNEHRMSYGDINYLGNNKALLYFDRGIRGRQTFTNSMQPLSKQPKYKDIIVVDDIVFTANCKCNSTHKHREMFPHYRVTCAVGLTCPARLNNIEREIYRRKRNASTEMYTKASAMLIRYWR